MHPAILRFSNSLGTRPYCSDDGTATRIRSRKTALEYAYVGLNRRRVCYLAFDIDRQGAGLAWEAAELPPPTLTMINPVNAHAHLLYELYAPVLMAVHARQKPIRFLEDIETRMVDRLGADHKFARLMIKNPIHAKWRTIAYDCKYDLGQLLEYLPIHKAPRKIEHGGGGRNCDLFNELRNWAYRRIEDAHTGTLDAWMLTCRDQAEKLNTFTPPLPYSEVKSIAKSVARWTYRKYTGSNIAGRVQHVVEKLVQETSLSEEILLTHFPGLVAKKTGVHRNAIASLRKVKQASALHQDI